MIDTRFCYVQYITIILKWNTHSHFCKSVIHIFYFSLRNILNKFFSQFWKEHLPFSNLNSNINNYHAYKLYARHCNELYTSVISRTPNNSPVTLALLFSFTNGGWGWSEGKWLNRGHNCLVNGKGQMSAQSQPVTKSFCVKLLCFTTASSPQW